MKRVQLLYKTRRGKLELILGLLVVVVVLLGVALAVRSFTDDAAPQSVAVTSDIQRLERIMLGSGGKMLYGLPADEYEIQQGEIESGETFSKLLNGRFDLNISTVNELVNKSTGKFNLKDWRAGNMFTAFFTPDSTQRLQYLVYDKSKTEFVLFDCSESKPSVKVIKREVSTTERYGEGVIKSSLYATIADNGMPMSLAGRLDNIFKWTIDFYAIQPGDSFRVIYEEIMVDTTSIGIGNIYGAEFVHGGKTYSAIRFEQDKEVGYWDNAGVNMRKSFLRSPLSFQARVSSKFGVRIHPIKRTRGMHNGVDYACAAGTPVYAIADGTVSFKGWDRGGGGNTLKISHAQSLQSGYLHLRGFAKSIKSGARVKQGQVIGYVGSTGMSTGPHLDFRIWKNGKPIDPTKMPSLPSQPIKAGNKAAFNVMKNDVDKAMKQYKSL